MYCDTIAKVSNTWVVKLGLGSPTERGCVMSLKNVDLQTVDDKLTECDLHGL